MVSVETCWGWGREGCKRKGGSKGTAHLVRAEQSEVMIQKVAQKRTKPSIVPTVIQSLMTSVLHTFRSY